jgi:hypothetical protein
MSAPPKRILETVPQLTQYVLRIFHASRFTFHLQDEAAAAALPAQLYGGIGDMVLKNREFTNRGNWWFR